MFISEMDKLKGDLVIKYYPTKTASVNTLSAHLKRITTLGTKVDMVVVDYADILKDTGNSREVRHALGNIYEDLRGLVSFKYLFGQLHKRSEVLWMKM